jgi:hypothetical protein
VTPVAETTAFARRNGLVVLVLVGTLAGVGERAAAQSKCQTQKYKAAGAVAKAKAACFARAAKAGGDVDPACVSAADDKLARKWEKAEAAGDCVTSGDAAAGVTATEQCLAAIDDVVDPPPPPSSPCCNLANSCAHGFDEAGCTEVFGGTLGPDGSVCDGATGTCVLATAGTGRCCMTSDGSFCTGGPALDLSACVPPDFLDFPFGSTCAPSGSCTLP